MSEMNNDLKKDILRLYTEPALGSSSLNSYGEENIKNLVHKYGELNEEEMQNSLTGAAPANVAAAFYSRDILAQRTHGQQRHGDSQQYCQ